MTFTVTTPSGETFVRGYNMPDFGYTRKPKEARRKTHREHGGPERDKSRHSKKTGLQGKPNRSRR